MVASAAALLTSLISDGAVLEDVANMIGNVSPKDRPFMMMINRGEDATDTSHIWNEDALDTPTGATTAEGTKLSASSAHQGTPERINNTTQITRKQFNVTDTDQARGRIGSLPSMISYQEMKATENLLNEMEFSLINNTKSAASQADRELGGLNYWATDGTEGAVALNAGYNLDLVTQTPDISEVQFNTLAQTMWTVGVQADTALISPEMKRAITTEFTNPQATNAATNTINIEARDRAVVFSIFTYVGDFGTVNMHLSRYNPDTGGTNFLFKRDMYHINYLRPIKTEYQARDGDITPGYVETEYTMTVDNRYAGGAWLNVGD